MQQLMCSVSTSGFDLKVIHMQYKFLKKSLKRGLKLYNKSIKSLELSLTPHPQLPPHKKIGKYVGDCKCLRISTIYDDDIPSIFSSGQLHKDLHNLRDIVVAFVELILSIFAQQSIHIYGKIQHSRFFLLQINMRLFLMMLFRYFERTFTYVYVI